MMSQVLHLLARSAVSLQAAKLESWRVMLLCDGHVFSLFTFSEGKIQS